MEKQMKTSESLGNKETWQLGFKSRSDGFSFSYIGKQGLENFICMINFSPLARIRIPTNLKNIAVHSFTLVFPNRVLNGLDQKQPSYMQVHDINMPPPWPPYSSLSKPSSIC